MKSSIMTMSCLRSSFFPGTASVVIRTDAMGASLNLIPMKERLASPGEEGTKLAKIRLPLRSKYSIRVLALCGLPPSGRSTSVKTTPKPLTVAGEAPLVPGMKNEPSVTLLPTGVNSRDGLNVVKMVAWSGY